MWKQKHSGSPCLIQDEVLCVEGDNYFVKRQDGREVTTRKTEQIKSGDRIEAKVDDNNHAYRCSQRREFEPIIEVRSREHLTQKMEHLRQRGDGSVFGSLPSTLTAHQ